MTLQAFMHLIPPA